MVGEWVHTWGLSLCHGPPDQADQDAYLTRFWKQMCRGPSKTTRTNHSKKCLISTKKHNYKVNHYSTIWIRWIYPCTLQIFFSPPKGISLIFIEVLGPIRITVADLWAYTVCLSSLEKPKKTDVYFRFSTTKCIVYSKHSVLNRFMISMHWHFLR